MANRYFINVGSNWSDSANWSDTSGGTGGFSVPTSSDNAYFDANSGNCTIDTASVCADLDFTGYTGTLSGTAALSVYGSFKLVSGMTYSYTDTITFAATSTGKTLTFGSKTTANSFTFDGSGGGWTVQDTWNNGSSNITLTRGTLNTNGQTLTCGTFSSNNTNVRTLTLGSSTINCRSWSFGSTTNLTFNANTSTIVGTDSGVSFSLNGGGLTYNVFTVTSTTSGTWQILGANTFATLTITGPTNKTQTVSLSANQTVTGTLTIAGNSETNRILVQSNTVGTARTITAATTTLSNVDFMDITGAGAGSWSGTSIGNALGNSGITFTTPVTRYAVTAGSWSSTGTWSATSGGASGASVPLCHDTVTLNASSGAGTYTADMPRLGADITCTGFTRTLALNSLSHSIYGSLTLVSGMTFTTSSSFSTTFRGRSSHTLTTAAKSFSQDINITAPGGTYTLQDNLTSTAISNGIILSNGTFDANDYNITAIGLNSNNNNVRTLNMGTGTWTLSGNTTVPWIVTSTLTLNAETATIILTGTGSSITFIGGGKTYSTLRLSGTGTGSYTITGSNTFTTFESTKTNTYSILFSAGTTQTITNWNITGSSGNVVTINSTTTGTHTLTKAGGGEVRSDYLSIQHSIATPSNTWYAGVNSTNNQSVATTGSGWLFTVPLPTCTTQAVSSISDLTATANGNATDDGSGIISERGFVYDTVSRSDPGNVAPASTSYASSITSTGTFSEGAFTGSMTGLTELTTYYVRAYCKNQAGYDYGTEVSFTTLESPAVPMLTTEAVSTITGTTAVGNGTITDDNATTVTRRGFVYSTTSRNDPGNVAPASSGYSGDANDTGTFTEGVYTKSITGLSNNTTYYVRAYAQNAIGYGYGNEVSFTTDRLPSVSVQNPTNRQSNTATLNGTVTDAGGDTITKRGFVWDTATQSAPGNVAPASSGYDFTQSENVSASEGVFDEAITGLSENTTYYVRAFAQNSLGYTYSDEISFTTVRYPGLITIDNLDTNEVTSTNTETPTEIAIINQTTNTVTLQNGT